MFLGIEIGGTKLQLAVGAGDGSPFRELVRRDVDARRAAAGIRDEIARSVADLKTRHEIERVGFGFGGPVLGAQGRIITSHQIDGWDDFALTAWCRSTLGLDAVLGNDCDVAALAEAKFGAGRGRRIVLYVTVGTGIGGGLVVDGVVHGTFRPAASEIGHLRPGLASIGPHDTVEAAASGRGLENAARRWLTDVAMDSHDAADLRSRCRGEVDVLTARHLAEAATAGNESARRILHAGVETLGWAVAQATTLLAPETVVVGGGVSLIGERDFFAPLRDAFRRYVFPPLANAIEIVPAALGEEVVTHGALALAASSSRS